MSSGRTHAKVSAYAAATVFVAGTAMGNAYSSAIIALGCLAGTVLTPDLDLPRGPFLWRLIWWPYQMALEHRSEFSHAPVLGTLGRVAYIIVPTAIVATVAGLRITDDSLPIMGQLFAGLCLSDALHAIMDALPKRRKG